MLILTRKQEEAIVIDKHILIKILSFKEKGREVRIGISAPPEIPVDRLEVFLQKQQQLSS